MARRRILYGLILVAAVLFQISNTNYLAPVLLTLTLALPLLSLLLSLPPILSCRLSLRARPAGLTRGDNAHWIIAPKRISGLPLARLTLVLEEKNLFTGKVLRTKVSLNGVTRQTASAHCADTSHCGLLEFRVKKLRAYDYLGLFAFPLPRPEPARLLVEPDPLDPGPLSIPEGWGARPSPGSAPRKSLGEDYDLREYRPGDPLRSVHWKLSSKWDDLIVREPAETFVPLLLLTFDCFGTGSSAHNPFESVDLNSAGPLEYSGITALRVTSNYTGHLYLRGASMLRYTGTTWEPLDSGTYDSYMAGGAAAGWQPRPCSIPVFSERKAVPIPLLF